MARPFDTTPDAHDVQFEAWRRMTGSERVALAIEMSDEARRIAEDGIRDRHPDYSAEEVRWALLRLLLGDDLFSAAYASAPLLPS
jgi:hypothetical protein